jgi:uncharacterized OB-fold protein
MQKQEMNDWAPKRCTRCGKVCFPRGPGQKYCTNCKTAAGRQAFTVMSESSGSGAADTQPKKQEIDYDGL